MGVKLGWVSYTVTLAFALGMLVGMVKIAWFPTSDLNGLAIFFGFGVPMLVLGFATHGLWHTSPKHTTMFGWSCTAVGLCWAVGLLLLVAGWSGLAGTGPAMRPTNTTADDYPLGLVLFAGFGIPMLVAGGAGVGVLIEQG